MDTYTGKQLAELLQREEPGMNLRTVRYYTQMGLLPPLELAGNKRVYTQLHLDHMRAILTLSRSGESLADIQNLLSGLSADEVAKIGERLRFYQPEHILEHETVVINEDVMLTLSPKISAKQKAEMVKAMDLILKGAEYQ